jgi:hypothetical protein
MHLFLSLLMTLLLMSGCNVYVAGSGESTGVVLDALTGRWQGEQAKDSGDYLLVSETPEAGLYRADIFEDGLRDASPLFSLHADRAPGEYWGLAWENRDNEEALLFHLSITGNGAEFHWPDSDRIEALLLAGGVDHERSTASGMFKWTTLHVKASADTLFQALQARNNQVLDDDVTRFRRVPVHGKSTGRQPL